MAYVGLFKGGKTEGFPTRSNMIDRVNLPTNEQIFRQMVENMLIPLRTAGKPAILPQFQDYVLTTCRSHIPNCDLDWNLNVIFYS